jgi:hypothetical protein
MTIPTGNRRQANYYERPTEVNRLPHRKGSVGAT